MFDKDGFEKTAKVLKALAHPIRLCIVDGLARNGPCNVSCMEECIKASQSGISQHLARLRTAGIVKSKRHGNEVYYELVSDHVKRFVKTILNNYPSK